MTWNVNGIRATFKKPGSLAEFFKSHQLDIICFQVGDMGLRRGIAMSELV